MTARVQALCLAGAAENHHGQRLARPRSVILSVAKDLQSIRSALTASGSRQAGIVPSRTDQFAALRVDSDNHRIHRTPAMNTRQGRSRRMSDRGHRGNGIAVRGETAIDCLAIEAVTTAAFLHAEHRSGTEQHIVAALRKADQLSVSLVVELDGRIVGHVAVSPVTISDGSDGWYGLGPISVLPEFQRTGIGSALMREALAALRQRGARGCVLLGDPAYYQRFGFAPNPRLVLPGVPAEYFQALPFVDALPTGTVTYHAAFDIQA
jgi:putative acetyltransferase